MSMKFRLIASTSALLILSACTGSEDQQLAMDASADAGEEMEMATTVIQDDSLTDSMPMQRVDSVESHAGSSQSDDSRPLPTLDAQPAPYMEIPAAHGDQQGNAKELPMPVEKPEGNQKPN